MPRARSPTHRAPRPDALPSGRKFRFADGSSHPGHSSVSMVIQGLALSLHALPNEACKPSQLICHFCFSLPGPITLVHEGEDNLGISHLGTCHGKFYSGTIRLAPDIMV